MDNQVKLWQEWDKTHNKKTLSQLVASFNPMIKSQINRFSSGLITPPVLEAEAKKLTIDAISSFNPRKANLGTHVFNHLKKLRRFTLKHQNIFKVPELKGLSIKTYQGVNEFLHEKLGRPPSLNELSEELKWPAKRITSIQNIIKGSVPESTMVYQDIGHKGPTIDYVYNNLDPKSQFVFEHLTGYQGSSQLNEKQIAKRLKITPKKIHKMKNKIIQSFQK